MISDSRCSVGFDNDDFTTKLMSFYTLVARRGVLGVFVSMG